MDIEKIKLLTNAIEVAQGIKFKVNNDKEIIFEGNYHKPPSVATAKELAQDLQNAIQPIVAKYEAELRKQLALCAKIKD